MKMLLVDNKIFLVKPNTLMNLSGKAAAYFQKSINPDEIIVVQDDLDIKLGSFKLKLGGSSAGHNGIKNISELIGDQYFRLKIGIDRPVDNSMVTNYVLGKFSNVERQVIFSLFSVMFQNIELLISQKEKFVSACLRDINVEKNN